MGKICKARGAIERSPDRGMPEESEIRRPRFWHYFCKFLVQSNLKAALLCLALRT